MKTIHEYMKLLSLELIPGRQIAAIQAILKQAMTDTVDRCVEVVDIKDDGSIGLEGYTENYIVDRQSILKVKQEIK